MGYDTREISQISAFNLIRYQKREVTEASKLEYFNSYNWKKQVIKTELREDDNSLYFTLVNGDFVRLELTR